MKITKGWIPYRQKDGNVRVSLIQSLSNSLLELRSDHFTGAMTHSDPQHSDTQHGDIQHDDIHHNNTQHIALVCETQHN